MIRYFGQSGLDGIIWAIYRYMFGDGWLLEEAFSQSKTMWEQTSYLTKMFTGGEATLSEITEEDAKKAFPLAFIDSQ